MSGKVLVAFGSKYGATAEIAAKIAEVLKRTGKDVDLMDARNVKDLAVYDAVVLGSAVYAGFWRREMMRLVEKNAVILANKKVWIFASGSTGEGDPIEEMGGRLYPPNLRPAIKLIAPVGITAFHGAMFGEKLNYFEKWIIKKLDGKMGDFRDWDRITNWAREIADQIA